MFREIMAIRTSQMMTSRSLICLLENQNGGKLQKQFYEYFNFRISDLELVHSHVGTPHNVKNPPPFNPTHLPPVQNMHLFNESRVQTDQERPGGQQRRDRCESLQSVHRTGNKIGGDLLQRRQVPHPQTQSR
jgi:hypothetical protein